MFTSEILKIYFSFIIKSSIYAVFCFMSLRDRIFILFLLMTWPAYLFPKKPKNFQIPLRIKWSSPKRYIGRPPDPLPLFELGYRLAKTCFNRIFPVSPFLMFLKKKKVLKSDFFTKIKRVPLMEMSSSASEIHVHCRTVWTVCFGETVCQAFV